MDETLLETNIEKPEINVNQAIQALFDSVYTINKTLSGDVTPGVDPAKVISINKEHIRLMLSKPEIDTALTQQQRDELNNCLGN